MTSVAVPLPAQSTGIVRVTARHAVTGAPIVDAAVEVRPSRRRCVTRGDGDCRLVVGAGSLVARVSAVGFAPDSQSLLLAPATDTLLAFVLRPSAAPLDPVVTLGARAAERTVGSSPVPIDVVSSVLLERTGLPETWQQLQRLVPSVNVPHIPIGDNHMRPVTLRGLAPHHVLLLVNGKRRHPAAVLLAGPAVPSTGFTDIGAIPSSAIDRIEILRDGAAAQYGSDAIGGVVNVILHSGARRDLRLSAGRAHTSEGGRDFRDGEWVSASGTYGLAAADGRRLTFSAELHDRDGTNRAYPDRRPQYFAGDPRNEAEPRVSSYLGNGAVRALTTLLSAGAPFGERAEGYAFGGVARRSGESPDAFFRRPSDARAVRTIHPDGFLPVIESRIDDLSLHAGVLGVTRGWRWDLSAGWGGNRVAYAVRGSNNASLGVGSPTAFDAGRVAAQQWTGNADVARELRIGTVPIDLAAGLELRLERYRIRAGEPDSWRDGGALILDGPLAGRPAAAGAQGMTGYRPADEVSARRGTSALYLELSGRPLRRLTLESAVRAEHAGDIGSTLDGKLAGRVQLAHGLAMRGSLGTAFRAPSLAQQHFSSTRTVLHPVNGVTTVLTVRTFPTGTEEARLLGASPLRPETAVNRSVGVVLETPRLPLVTADLYQIDVADRIALPTSITDTSIVRLFEEGGMRGVGGGNYFSNAMDTRTRGVDVVASHALLVGGSGVLRILGGYNHTRTKVTRVAPPPPQLAAFGAQLFDRTSLGVVEHGQPRQSIALTLQYGAGAWELDLHNQRSGPTALLDRASPDEDQVVRARWITDARAAFRPHPRMQVALSVANLFDVYPDEWRDFRYGVQGQGSSMQGVFRHPGALSPFGMSGRAVYAHVAFR